MEKWKEYERRKKLLQIKLDKKQISHEEYLKKIEKICDELGI